MFEPKRLRTDVKQWMQFSSDPSTVHKHPLLSLRSLKKVELKQAARQTWFSQRLEFPPGPWGLWHITNQAQRLMASVSSDDATTGLVGQKALLIRSEAKTNFRTHTVNSLRQWRSKKKKVEGGRGSFRLILSNHVNYRWKSAFNRNLISLNFY